MDKLQVRCSRCKEELELDPGFAGGVCRCSACGALMRVPGGEDSNQRKSNRKRNTRPEVPMAGPVPPEAEDTRGGTSLFGFTLARPKRESSVDQNGSIDKLEESVNGQLQVMRPEGGKLWVWIVFVLVVLAVLGGVGYWLGWIQL